MVALKIGKFETLRWIPNSNLLEAKENFRWTFYVDSIPVESFFSCFSWSILWRGSLQKIIEMYMVPKNSIIMYNGYSSLIVTERLACKLPVFQLQMGCGQWSAKRKILNISIKLIPWHNLYTLMINEFNFTFYIWHLTYDIRYLTSDINSTFGCHGMILSNEIDTIPIHSQMDSLLSYQSQTECDQ